MPQILGHQPCSASRADADGRKSFVRFGVRHRAARVVTREALFERVWGYELDLSSNSLAVFISNLRRKLEEGGEPRLIHTVRGVGYVLREG